MTDYGGLGAVALILYLWECAVWVPDGAEAFRVPLRGRWRLARESWALERPRGRLVIAALLPGAGGIALCETRPPRLSPSGVCVCDERRGAKPGATLSWEALEPLRADGRAVRSGSRVVWKTGTARYAAHVAEVAERARRARPDQRGEIIEPELDRLLDDGEVRRQVDRVRHASWVLRGMAWATALVLVLAVPAALARRDMTELLAVVIAVWALAATTAALYARRRRALLGTHTGGGSAWSMVLLPLAALRADDFLAREAFATHHAWAVARGAQAAPPWRRPEEAEGDEVAGSSAPEPCCEAAAWVENAWRRCLDRHAAADPSLPAIRRESDDAVAYCPRCLQQYARLGECADCSGVTLVPIG